jgi:predicted amidophosphoribosyltransferase
MLSALFILILGIALGVLWAWPAAVVGLIAALAVDRPQWLCPFCGNRVEKSTVYCPHCQEDYRV